MIASNFHFFLTDSCIPKSFQRCSCFKEYQMKLWRIYLNWSQLTIVLLLLQRKSRRNRHVLAFTQIAMHWNIHTKSMHFSVFPALMDPITRSKSANTVHNCVLVVMLIQLFLMDTLSIMNLSGERFSRQIAAHMVNVDYANVRYR